MPASPSQFYLWAVPLLAANKRVITILRAIQLLIKDENKYKYTLELTHAKMLSFKVCPVESICQNQFCVNLPSGETLLR